MWIIDAIVVLVTLACAIWTGLQLHACRRRVPRTPHAAPDARGRPAFLLVALLLLLADAAFGGLVALGDAGLGPWAQDSYRVLGLITGSAQVGLAAAALALVSLAVPMPQRSAASKATAVGLFVVAFGIVSCYGVLLSR